MRTRILPIYIAVASVLAVSCDPQAFTMALEMRQPSDSGLDLGGKSIAVAYVDSGKDDGFARGVANGFAQALEQDYFGGREVIDVYSLEGDEDGVYSSLDTLQNLVVESDNDVVFVFDEPSFGAVEPSSVSRAVGNFAADSAFVSSPALPYSIRLYVYDSMDKRDTVRVFAGSSKVHPKVYQSTNAIADDLKDKAVSAAAEIASTVGEKSAKRFVSSWKSENYTFMYFDSPKAWDKASSAAYELRWKDAIDSWMKLAASKDSRQRSCAEFNIAQALYLMGDYALATEWLDRSDADYAIPLSKNLRKRITAKMK